MKKLFLALVTFISVSAFASVNATRSSDIVLGGGDLPATKEFNLNLNPLLKQLAYDITCDIIDDNNASNKVTIQIGSGDAYANIGSIDANQHFVGTGGAQFPLAAVNNQIVIHHVYASADSAKIIFRNSDQRDWLVIKNCVAKASDLSNS